MVSIKYRPDIDGLRAIAVISVILYHYFPNILPSGYIGVDVFFVISGYLITLIISREIHGNKFSFVNFYSRRILRLFPALILVLSSILFYGYISLNSLDYERIGLHTFSASFYFLNFILKEELGYFDVSSIQKPILHLWSLSIEEQFYLFFPIFFLFLFKQFSRKTSVSIVLILVTFVLFTINVMVSLSDADKAFYMPFTRAWELLLGGLIAILQVFHRFELQKKISSYFSLSGFALLTFGFLYLNEDSLYPGYNALIPVIAAGLIIVGGNEAFLNKYTLSNRVAVYIGKISYPLYLWHYPLIAFTYLLNGQQSSYDTNLVLLLISIFLSVITYHFVEYPLRFKTEKKTTVSILFSLAFLIGIVGFSIHSEKGIPKRENAGFLTEQYIGDLGNEPFYTKLAKSFYKCDLPHTIGGIPEWREIKRCFQSKENLPVDLVIFGDSHAEHLFPGLAQLLPHKNVAYYVHGRGPPFKDIGEINRLISFLNEQKSIRNIIVSSSWVTRIKRLKATTLFEELNFLAWKLERDNLNVYLTDDLLRFTFLPQTCKYLRPWPFSTKCEDDISQLKSQQELFLPDLIRAADKYSHVSILKTSEYFCNEWTCNMVHEDKILFRDRAHLNFLGSKFIASKILDEIPGLSE